MLGLEGQLQDGLVLWECLKDLNSFISLAIEMNIHHRERHCGQVVPTSAPFSSLLRLACSGCDPLSSSALSVVSPAGSEPMQIGRARLTLSER